MLEIMGLGFVFFKLMDVQEGNFLIRLLEIAWQNARLNTGEIH